MTMATPDAPPLAAVSDTTFLTDLAEHLTVPARAEEFMGLVEHMGKAATLLLEFLGSYIASETSPHTIFREDSLATRLLGATVFLSTNTQFLRLTVLPLVMTIRANPKQYLLDASRGASKSTAQLNALRSTISTFLTAVATNITYCSASLRFVLASVEDLVQKKFPSHSVLSSLFFLRFLCPAIVRCETIFVELGQMDTDERRAVVLVTKVLQSIANGVDMKETLYSPLNTFVHEQHTAVASLCVKLIDASSFQVSCLEQLGSRRTTLVSPYPEPSSETLRFVTPFISQSDISVVHPLLWSCDDVQTWLDRGSLVDCKAVCAKYKVNGSMLVLLPDPGLPEVKLHKAQRKQLTAAVQALLTERTRFFPAYKAPEKWTTNEVLDYLSFMDLSAFSFTIRTLSTKVAFPGTSLLRLRDDDMRVLGVDAEKDRQAILDRVMDGSFVQHRMDSHSDTRRRASAPSWIERRVRHSASAENEQTAGDLD